MPMIKKDKRRIPKGYYCYSCQNYKEFKFKDIKVCPYWSLRRGKPKQNNGYCAYLEKGDWDINNEQRWRREYTRGKNKGKKDSWKTANEIGLYMSLLWDQVKECGVKEELCVEESRQIDKELKKHGKKRAKKRN